MLELLLFFDAPLNAEDMCERTPISVAQFNEDKTLVKVSIILNKNNIGHSRVLMRRVCKG